MDVGMVMGATAIIDEEVFEPKNLIDCLEHYSIPADQRRSALIANTPVEAKHLLQALLADWLDFVFLPKPTSFVLYADHDEYHDVFRP